MKEYWIVYTVRVNRARAMTAFSIAEAITIATAIAMAYSHTPCESVGVVTTLSSRRCPS